MASKHKRLHLQNSFGRGIVSQSLTPTHPLLLPHPLLLRYGSDKKTRPGSEYGDPAMTQPGAHLPHPISKIR
ncbi:bifunctional dethiobiotin synthetase/7,8-diamino-pelargonic acid aminotransferase, mitochondrial [Iris pallida]|uniref:Bifunctional dethiobiotin synthetase/7,8-diamino-pelargonic acid aminotransferase, mitochondrial n=1 Tax=Iris pallida TaxID=29817 RepID=A0AAX6GR19_IRIPA|nr:bifunctional dethiobiotin synthetase/7,8-diamino-pelargonic acid aminotransferase, mitochondrial [Iris pallida]